MEPVEVIHRTTTHEKIVTWERAFSGWAMKLRLVQCKDWVAVSLEGAPDGTPRIIEVSVDVLRQIVAMADALPPIPPEMGGPTP